MNSVELFLENFLLPYRNAGIPEEQLTGISDVFKTGYMTGIHFALENLLLKNNIDPNFIPRISPN